jgi:hypothetical protein
MSVVKKGNRWYVVLELGRDPKTGKRKQRWVSSWKTKREALKDEVKEKHELVQGSYTEPNKITKNG